MDGAVGASAGVAPLAGATVGGGGGAAVGRGGG